ncbi:hypothetical protein GCM10027598_34870 [Amycolatopsis oliviviridis]
MWILVRSTHQNPHSDASGPPGEQGTFAIAWCPDLRKGSKGPLLSLPPRQLRPRQAVPRAAAPLQFPVDP